MKNEDQKLVRVNFHHFDCAGYSINIHDTENCPEELKFEYSADYDDNEDIQSASWEDLGLAPREIIKEEKLSVFMGFKNWLFDKFGKKK